MHAVARGVYPGCSDVHWSQSDPAIVLFPGLLYLGTDPSSLDVCPAPVDISSRQYQDSDYIIYHR